MCASLGLIFKYYQLYGKRHTKMYYLKLLRKEKCRVMRLSFIIYAYNNFIIACSINALT